MWGPKWSWGWLPDSTTFAMHENTVSDDHRTMADLMSGDPGTKHDVKALAASEIR